MDQPFRGFGSESFAFFQELSRRNNKAWFDRNRSRYEEHVNGGFRSLLVELEPFLLRLNPNFETAGKTNRNFSRINRDIRFSKDKSPYKPNFYLYVFDRRRERDKDGRFYVGLSAECVTVGFSIYAAWDRGPKGALETVFRQRVAAHPEVLNGLVWKTVIGKRFDAYWYRQEKKQWALHPGVPKREEDWLSMQGWVVRKVFAPTARGLAGPRFIQTIERIFAELYPLYAFTSVAGARWRAELKRKLPAPGSS
ncbi:MAG: DUF2461 domain-containing protein [Acidobacteria bacterium]|nr:DUF2461 domain-containing protein [Acidobacteriota bacterium]